MSGTLQERLPEAAVAEAPGLAPNGFDVRSEGFQTASVRSIKCRAPQNGHSSGCESEICFEASAHGQTGMWLVYALRRVWG